MNKRHRVFVSFHHANDQYYKQRFENLFCGVEEAVISGAVNDGDIDVNASTERIADVIRDKYLRNTTVTTVLIGRETWKRKHVDWEIASSIRHSLLNSRSGLVGIILPTHPSFNTSTYDPCLVPARLMDNIQCGYAKIFNWTEKPDQMIEIIHDAFLRRTTDKPNQSRPLLKINHDSHYSRRPDC